MFQHLQECGADEKSLSCASPISFWGERPPAYVLHPLSAEGNPPSSPHRPQWFSRAPRQRWALCQADAGQHHYRPRPILSLSPNTPTHLSRNLHTITLSHTLSNSRQAFMQCSRPPATTLPLSTTFPLCRNHSPLDKLSEHAATRALVPFIPLFAAKRQHASPLSFPRV